MKEAHYQKLILKYINSIGHAFKVSDGGRKGIPDVVGCINGKFIAVEVKTPEAYSKKDNNTSDLQRYHIDKIHAAKGAAIVAHSVEQVKEYLHEMGILTTSDKLS